jgi:hypothetical protein
VIGLPGAFSRPQKIWLRFAKSFELSLEQGNLQGIP